ncbi:MAG: hypothetical protein WCX80_05090, partial [Patescibacteria group bacterium]
GRSIRSVMGNNMEKEIFDREISMCRELSKKNNGKCNWGECDKCGVIPLLYKLSKGEIVEKEDEVRELKSVTLK